MRRVHRDWISYLERAAALCCSFCGAQVGILLFVPRGLSAGGSSFASIYLMLLLCWRYWQKNASACTHVRIGKVPRRIWIGSRERRRKHSIHLCSQFIICFVIGKTETHSIRGAFTPLSARFHFIMHPARKLPICCFLFAPQPQLHKFYDSLWMSWGIFSLPGVPRVTCNIVWKNWCKIGLGHQLLWQIYVNQKHSVNKKIKRYSLINKWAMQLLNF